MNDITNIEDKLAKLKVKYILSLPDKTSDIYQQWHLCKSKKSITESDLVSHLHKLAGSAGMHDLFDLGEKARYLELTVININDTFSNETVSEIDILLEQLKTMINQLSEI